MEGAEALQQDPKLLDVLYDAGLRSIGPLWNRPSQFGHGLNAKFPHSPNTGPGLTVEGKALIARCADKKMLVDVSHMNERAFWDTVNFSATDCCNSLQCLWIMPTSTKFNGYSIKSDMR